MASTETMTFNKKINLVKLILSSLFARKQPYLVVDGNVRGKLFVTNIPDDRAVFYKPDIDDTLHEVKLTEYAMKYFYEIFPTFKDCICIVHLPTMLSTMNKRLAVVKNEAPAISVNKDTEVLTMLGLPKKEDGTKAVFNGTDASEFVPVKIGHLIPEDVFVKYEEIVARFMSFIKEPIERTVTVSSAVGDDKFILNNVVLDNSVYDCVVFANIPISDGKTVVSYKEYLAKKKLPWKLKALIMYNPKRSVAKVAYEHKDDLVDVLCTSPGTLWFPFKKK